MQILYIYDKLVREVVPVHLIERRRKEISMIRNTIKEDQEATQERRKPKIRRGDLNNNKIYESLRSLIN